MYTGAKYRLSQHLLKQVISKRLFRASITLQSWNPVIYSRNLDLGRSLFVTFGVQSLPDLYPHLDAAQINDTVQGGICLSINFLYMFHILGFVFSFIVPCLYVFIRGPELLKYVRRD